MKYRVYAALEHDIDSGRVWIGGNLLSGRTVVRITNVVSCQSIYCEALKLDSNYLSQYIAHNTIKIVNDSTAVVMSQWYRTKLGITRTNIDAELDIEIRNGWFGELRNCLAHPQVVVRIAVKLAILGLLLGIVSIWLGILSLDHTK